MSRMTGLIKNSPLGDQDTSRDVPLAEQKEEYFIQAHNDLLEVREGYKLAVIDENDRIVKKGEPVNNELFLAMRKQAIESFCRRFKSFDEKDFKD